MKKSIIAFLLISMSAFAQEKMEVFFDFNKDIPNVNSTEILNKWMNENRDVEVVKLSGYCDSIDNSNYNKDLAMRRINSILQNLKQSNIKINANVVLENNGKDFKQSKNQAENRKVIVFYNKPQKPVVKEVKKEIVPEIKKEIKLTETVKTSKKGDLIKLKNLYFENNSDKMVSKSQPTLDELLMILKSDPKLKIEIQGHICCKKPTDPDVVSQARAKAVYDFLLKNKIDVNRLSYKGYGVSKPVHPIPEKNTQEEDENRRVEIMIVEK